MNLLEDNREVFFLLLIILYISLLFLSPLFSLYFWRDDFFILYKASHNQSSFWPYYIAHIFYIPLWDLFKLSPLPYFLVGFILRMIIAVTYFLVFKRLTNNSYFSFFVAALWSVSPIGFENNMLIVTTISMFFGLMFQLLFLFFFIQKKIILSLIFIFLEFLITPDRGGGLIFFSFFLILTPFFLKERYQKIKFFISSMIATLLGIFISKIISVSDKAWESNILSLEVIMKNFLDVKAFFFLFANSLLPSDLWNFYANSQSIIWLLGLIIFSLIFLLLLKIKKDAKFINLLVGLLWVVSNILIIYLFQHYLNQSEDRYYSSMSLGAALITISIFYLLPKRAFITLSILVIVTFGVITNNYLNIHLSKHSYYARPFWQAFKNEVPIIENKTLFVIKLESNNTEVLNRYADIVRVGALVSEASIAVHIGADLDKIKLVDNWDEEQLLKDISVAKNNNYDVIYFLYNGKDLKKIY